MLLGEPVRAPLLAISPHNLSFPQRPTGGVALAFLFFTLHLNPVKHGKTFAQHVQEFDFLGLTLLVAGVVCVLMGFNQSEFSCAFFVTCDIFLRLNEGLDRE